MEGGLGSEIKVWTDSWLPGTPQIIAPLQNGNFDPILRVAALLDARSSVWDVEAPRHYFDEECQDCILAGKMGWGLMSNANQDEDDRRLWRLVWKLGGPPNGVKHELHRGPPNGVKHELHRRHLTNSDLCSLCGTESETISHALFDCPGVKQRIFEDKSLDMKVMAACFAKSLHSFRQYASRVFSGSVRAAQQLVSSLVRPPADYLGSFPKEWNVDVAQVAAIRFGCQVARRLGYDSLWVEGDSLTNDTSHGYPPIWLLVDEVPSIAKFFNFYKKDKFVSDDVDTQGPKGEDDNKVLSSTSRVDVHPALKKKKLHWGLDAKERWERKANILVGDDPAVCILVDEYWDYFG
uniref:Reverse transcriptase zinc-binding domain-containing protein n=1 Tax=Chenopodium quinoa TaxID=63459 RepID=A0A803NCV6_CHEQI